MVGTGGGLGLDQLGTNLRPEAAPPVRIVEPLTFEDVYRADYARMVRIAHLLTGSNEAAEDVVQDAFVGLLSRFHRLDDPAAYVYRSVVNGCWSRRRHTRVVERLRHLASEPAVAIAPSEIDETWRILARLPERRRAVMVLRFYADLPLAEIAEILDCKVSTVKSILRRTLRELEEVLDR